MTLSKTLFIGKLLAFILCALTIVSAPQILIPSQLISWVFILLILWSLARFYFLFNSYGLKQRLGWTLVSDLTAIALLLLAALQMPIINSFVTGLLVITSFYVSIMMRLPSPSWFQANFRDWLGNLFFLNRY